MKLKLDDVVEALWISLAKCRIAWSVQSEGEALSGVLKIPSLIWGSKNSGTTVKTQRTARSPSAGVMKTESNMSKVNPRSAGALSVQTAGLFLYAWTKHLVHTKIDLSKQTEGVYDKYLS